MSRPLRVAVVVAGYGAAIAAAVVAAWMYNARVAALPYDTSGGMYAAGEAMYSLGAFLVVALVPTLLALWFLRSHEKFWNLVAVASLVFAVAGLLAVLTPLVTRSTGHFALALIGLLALAAARDAALVGGVRRVCLPRTDPRGPPQAALRGGNRAPDRRLRASTLVRAGVTAVSGTGTNRYLA